MAKRKRLTPANPMFLDTPTSSTGVRAPIADVARHAAGSAAFEELADALHTARQSGELVIRVPLDAVDLDYLVRDRVAFDEGEMSALEASIAARGQQTPVDVVSLQNGRYGLISGWRRIKALTRLYARTQDNKFSEVLALLRKPADSANAYLAMVEENEVRVGLSYFERARIVAKSVEQGVFATEREALQTLFEAASRAKRSKIGSFLPLVQTLDGALRFPQAIGERLGVQLGRALDDNNDLGRQLVERLSVAKPESAEDEVSVLESELQNVGNKHTIEVAEPSQTSPTPKPNSVAMPQEEPIASHGGNRSTLLVRPGVELIEDSRGRLVLRGSQVDSALKDRLIAWLRES